MATPTSTRRGSATERSASRSGGGTPNSPRRGPSEEYDIVRLLAQKQDFERRIVERDERNNELQKKLYRAETRVREASDSLAAERAERQQAEEMSNQEIQVLKLEAEKQRAVIANLTSDLQGLGNRAMDTIANLAHAKREALEQLAVSKAQIESLRAEVVRAESLIDEFHAERVRHNAIDADHEQERLSLQQALADANDKLAARAPLYVNERPSRRVVAPKLVAERPMGSKRVVVPILSAYKL